MVAGVATGLATYLDIDPVLVRVGFVLGAFANGIGVLAYLILWILVPQRPYAYDLYPEAEATTNAEPPKSKSSLAPATVFGAILVGVGFMALMDNLLPNVDFDELWPLVLIAMGVGLVVHTVRQRQQEPVVAPPPTQSTPPSPDSEEPQSYSSPQ